MHQFLMLDAIIIMIKQYKNVLYFIILHFKNYDKYNIRSDMYINVIFKINSQSSEMHIWKYLKTIGGKCDLKK